MRNAEEALLNEPAESNVDDACTTGRCWCTFGTFGTFGNFGTTNANGVVKNLILIARTSPTSTSG